MKIGLLRFGKWHRDRMRAVAHYRKATEPKAVAAYMQVLQTLALAATPLPQDGVGH